MSNEHLLMQIAQALQQIAAELTQIKLSLHKIANK